MTNTTEKHKENFIPSAKDQSTSSKALASIKPNGQNMLTLGGQEFKVTKRVTVPTLSHDTKKGIMAVAVEFVTPFVESDSKMAGSAEGAKVNSARVIDLTTGDICNYVGGVVVVSEINQAYPDKSYVGRKMVIKKMVPADGKRYSRAEIYEIE